LFIPLHDANSLKHIQMQYVTIGLIAANVLVFLFTALGSETFSTAAVIGLGYIPSTLYDIAERPSDLVLVPDYATYVTYAFLHGDIFHLGGNMLFLWVFGDNVEDAMGHAKFLLFYLACGVFAALFHAWMVPDSDLPLIGASGAVAGVIAAYLMLHPRVNVWVLAFKVIPLRITAGFVLGIWVALQIVMVAMPDVGPVAWWAHIGGLIAGAVLIVFMRRPGVPLFDRNVRLA
jgi:membrane associated rhomboid family serine protease